MPVRTTLTEIQKVLNTSVTDATIFIEMANSLVDQVVVPADTTGSLDDTRLTHIETWLAAHFITVFEPTAKSESAGPVSATYHGKSGYMLHSSIHGQTAILLDTTGALAQLHNDATDPDTTAKTPTIGWAGTGLNKDSVD